MLRTVPGKEKSVVISFLSALLHEHQLYVALVPRFNDNRHCLDRRVDVNWQINLSVMISLIHFLCLHLCLAEDEGECVQWAEWRIRESKATPSNAL
jgi:hypothetical protein